MFLARVVVGAVEKVCAEAVESEAEDEVVEEREEVGEGGDRRASKGGVWYVYTTHAASPEEF